MTEELTLWPEAVESADGFQPVMKTFLLDGVKKPRGMVLVLPGGGYRARAAHEADPIARTFNAAGYHAAVVHYRVNPNCHPIPQLDALRSIRLVRARAKAWGVDPGAVAILGFSAGGHLAASCGTLFSEFKPDAGDAIDRESARPDAMVLCYPVIRFDTFGHEGSGRQHLGESYDTNSALVKHLRLDERVSTDTPPAFLWHTATDQVVPVENSIAFAKAIWAHGGTAALHIFPKGPHGIGLAGSAFGFTPAVDRTFDDAMAWPKLAAEFLRVNCNFNDRD